MIFKLALPAMVAATNLFANGDLTNLNTVINYANLATGSKSHFNGNIDGETGITVNKMTNDRGAYITFGYKVPLATKRAVVTKIIKDNKISS